MNGLITDTKRQANGTLTTILYNPQGRVVATIENHNFTAEEVIAAARQFRDDHPDLFGDQILLDTAAENERKNPNAFRDGLSPVPGN